MSSRRKASTNPLLANTTDEATTEIQQTATKQEEPPALPAIEQQPAPVVEQVVETPMPPVLQPVVQVQPPAYVAPKLPPAPQARRVNRKVKFNDQFDKRTLSIDKRLLPYFDALMENGPNKTVVANQWVLKMLLDAGYQIDPNILTQPYKKPR